MCTFPSDFPKNCPFEGAKPADQVVYRLVNQSPTPANFDFLTHAELKKMPKADPCLRCGLSVFLNIEDACHQRDALRFLGKFIAKAKLGPEHGMTQLTKGKQPTHTTWWVYEGVKRESLFECIDESI